MSPSLSKKEFCQDTAFRLELQLFPESPACQPTPSDFGLIKPFTIMWTSTLKSLPLSLFSPLNLPNPHPQHSFLFSEIVWLIQGLISGRSWFPHLDEPSMNVAGFTALLVLSEACHVSFSILSETHNLKVLVLWAGLSHLECPLILQSL